MGLAGLRNLALGKARYRWILYWDADMVFFDGAAKRLRGLLESLDRERHHMIYWPMILLCGDLFHYCRGLKTPKAPKEGGLQTYSWLFTRSRETRFGEVKLSDEFSSETLLAPLRLYRMAVLRGPMGLHLYRVRRTPARLAVKELMWRFRRTFEEGMARGLALEEIARSVAEKLMGTSDLNEVGLAMIGEMVKDAPTYRGPYPEVLRGLVEGGP